MQDSESPPEQASHVSAVNSSNWRAKVLTIIATTLIAGTGGYLLGSRVTQPLPPPLPPQTKSIAVSPSVPTPTSNPLFTVIPAPTDEPRTYYHWQTYTDATLSATFSYPTTWKIKSSVTGGYFATGFREGYELIIGDQNGDIVIISDLMPDTRSLADLYRRYLPGTYTNNAFQEIINPQGVRFEQLIHPSFNNYEALDTIHNGRDYKISSQTYVDDHIIYNHLINSFTFTEDRTETKK